MKSREITITLHVTQRELRVSFSPLPGLHLVGRGGDWNIERKYTVLITFRHQVVVHLTSLRGITKYSLKNWARLLTA